MFHEEAILPQGFSCASKNCGLKADGAEDLSVIYSDTVASAAAVFTKNQVPGAPVIVGRELIQGKKLQALIINSKISNVGTGSLGVENARKMGRAVAKEFDCDANHVLMSSTGVIAVQLPIEKIEQGVVGIKSEMKADPLIAAKGIMTTDTHPKAYSMSVGSATVTLIAKGSGMIEPNMATMLAYAMTDAEIEDSKLDEMLRIAVN